MRSPSWAADRLEADARAWYRREKALNEVIERRNPRLQPTAAYKQEPQPASNPVFYTPERYWRYRARREMGKFDPNVVFDSALPSLNRQ